MDFDAQKSNDETGDDFVLSEEEENVNGNHNQTESIQQKRAQCFPLYSILLALGMDKLSQFHHKKKYSYSALIIFFLDHATVDYMMLSLNGAELSVLNTIPFDKASSTTFYPQII